MVDPVVGFRFRPTDEEIVGHYVRPKNLESNTSHVDEVMNTVDIYSFDPWELPCKSRIKSTEEVWYFFGCKKNQRHMHNKQSRRTRSGFWSKTGVTTEITRKRGGGDREKIGEKRVFVFRSNSKILGGPSKSKSDWVMHEYMATFSSPDSPPNQTVMTTYTVCKVMFKGDPKDLPSSSSSAGEIEHDLSLIPHVNNSSGEQSTETELENPRHFTGFLGLEEEAQFEDEMCRVINNLPTDDWNSLFNNDVGQGNTMFMQEDRNDYRPKKSLTGSDGDSDSDSITTTVSIN
ncbi:NAC domain-containing protein 5-like [Raphanus sativus]|uniref:NAC domain-containing protein 5-like n=1 Tax=Raphanus sativus TaxID=3726 RepID=A0A9W3D5Q6_RAPSA|nr:NAC domain-containing protein 5-like [Raphanus sativus]